MQPGDTFELSLRIKNKTDQVWVARIGHIVAPQHIADYLDFVQCGFLCRSPCSRSGAGISGTYMLRGSLPEGIRQLALTYDSKFVNKRLGDLVRCCFGFFFRAVSLPRAKPAKRFFSKPPPGRQCESAGFRAGELENQRFESSRLRGKVIVLNFIYDLHRRLFDLYSQPGGAAA